MKHVKKIIVFILLVIPGISYSAEETFVKDLTDNIGKVQKEFSELSKGESAEAKIIDEAIKEIDKATEFVKEAINNNNNADAIKALEFIEKSLTDVSSLVPAEYTSDMANADMSSIKEDEMKEITNITDAMASKKDKNFNSLVSNMMELSEKGLDTFEISKSLNDLGVDTIKIDIALKKQKEMETWSKEHWSNSWKGDVLTDDGNQIIAAEEMDAKLKTLEEKLANNDLLLSEKKGSLYESESKLDPLNVELSTLAKQKENVIAKYNSELIKQASNNLSTDQINQSKELSNKFNEDLQNLSKKINNIEGESSQLSAQITTLTAEIGSDTLVSKGFSSQISVHDAELQNTQKLLTSRKIQLNDTKSSIAEQNNDFESMNKRLEETSLQRDFIQTQFERSIDKEVEHLKVYGRVLGDTEAEMEFSLREVGVILDSDPRRARAFELEKYGTYAGLSPDAIQNGITAIQNDNWGTQKEFYKEVITKLSKNPNWVVDVPSNAELNVLIAEEQALQNAVFAAIEGQKIKQKVDSIINSKIEEFNKNNELTKFSADVFKNHSERMFHKGSYSGWSTSITDEYKQVFENEVNSLLNGENKRIFEENQVQIERYNYAKAAGKYDTWSQAAWDDYRVFSTAESVNSNLITRVGEQAKLNLINKIEEVEKAIENIKTKEIAQADGYNYVDKVKEILGEVPTFSEDLQRIDQKNKWNNAFVDTPSIYDDPAALRAAMEGANDLEAYEAARDAMQKIGETPVSEYMTGPYWEMSNVKVAAIVRSKKYDYIDDYAYLNAYYDDPINLTSAERIEAEEELSRILSKDNPRLNALNKEIVQLNNQIGSIKIENQNFNSNIAGLEQEIKSLENTEKKMTSELNNLTKDFQAHQEALSSKHTSLQEFQDKLSPINSEIEKLNSEKNNLTIKFHEQTNKFAKNLSEQEKIDVQTKTLKEQYEKELAGLNKKITGYEKESKSVNQSIESLTSELKSLQIDAPNVEVQIAKLNENLKIMIDIKADFAMTSATKMGVEIDEAIINSVAALDNKSIILIEGTSLMRVVDTDMLTDKAGNFKTPVGTMTSHGQVYTAGAVDRQRLLSVANIDQTGDLKVSVSKVAAEKINAGVFGLETAQGIVATDDMGAGVYTLIDPKTGRQVIDSYTGMAVYGGSVCSGEVCGPSGTHGKQALAMGYVYVQQASEGGTMCTDGNCVFNLGNTDMKTFNEQVAANKIEVSAGATKILSTVSGNIEVSKDLHITDQLARSIVNTVGVVDVDTKAIGEAAEQAVTTQKYVNSRFSIMTDGGAGAQALLDQAKSSLERISANNPGSATETATAQVAAQAQVAAAVAAQQASQAATEVAKAASEAASEVATDVAKVASVAAAEAVKEVETQLHVIQVIRMQDGTMAISVSATGTNLGHGQTAVWTGLTDAPRNASKEWTQGGKEQAISEAEAATGLDVYDVTNSGKSK